MKKIFAILIFAIFCFTRISYSHVYTVIHHNQNEVDKDFQKNGTDVFCDGVDDQLEFSDDYLIDEFVEPINSSISIKQLACIDNSLKDLTPEILFPPPQAIFSIV